MIATKHVRESKAFLAHQSHQNPSSKRLRSVIPVFPSSKYMRFTRCHLGKKKEKPLFFGTQIMHLNIPLKFSKKYNLWHIVSWSNQLGGFCSENKKPTSTYKTYSSTSGNLKSKTANHSLLFFGQPLFGNIYVGNVKVGSRRINEIFSVTRGI
jgi:hypothetical protein